MRPSIPGLTLGLSLLLVGGAAGAVDGVLEIDQTCAVITGCFAGDDPGFPVTLSVPGASDRLTSALVLPSDTDGVVIAVNGVSFDLGGFEIRGPVSCSGGPPPICVPNSGTGTGISGTGAGASVPNGTVRGMQLTGVALGAHAEVTELRLHFNRGFAVYVGNGSSGIDVGPRSLVAHNMALSNLGNGITAGPGSTITNNTASGNSASGISTGGASPTPIGALVIGNTASDNTRYGLILGAQSGYRENVLSGNGLGAVNGTSILNLADNACNAALCP
jgi:hypothetical protein